MDCNSFMKADLCNSKGDLALYSFLLAGSNEDADCGATSGGNEDADSGGTATRSVHNMRTMHARCFCVYICGRHSEPSLRALLALHPAKISGMLLLNGCDRSSEQFN